LGCSPPAAESPASGNHRARLSGLIFADAGTCSCSQPRQLPLRMVLLVLYSVRSCLRFPVSPSPSCSPV
jgi:hypothetical protein